MNIFELDVLTEIYVLVTPGSSIRILEYIAIFAILVTVFVTIGEHQKEYLLIKGWSFWMQISVILIDIAVTSLCAFESVRFLRLHLQQQIDPTGKRAETYGNPSFDAESPELPRLNHSNNGAIAFTESSGQPYNPNPVATSKKDKDLRSKNSRETAKDSFQTLTYENECYQESSPTLERASDHRH